MRQRTEVFATIILLANVLRQGKKKKEKKKDCIKRAFLNFIDCLTFNTLTNFYCYFYRKEIQNVYCIDIVKIIKLLQNSKCIIMKMHIHARDIIHCRLFLCAALIFTENMFFREKVNLFFVVCIFF